MKVNGKAFKTAREEILKDSGAITPSLKGEPSPGTQEWLAQVAHIRSSTGILKPLSVRTVQYLEKGEASIQTVDAVSPHLKINGRELIIGYGLNQINCNVPNVVDFRSISSPRNDPENFKKDAFVITLDPIIISFSEGDLDSTILKKITATLKIEKVEVDFQWIYEVALNPTGQGWLGIKKEVNKITIDNTGDLSFSVMFSQKNYPSVSWIELINMVESSRSPLIKIDVNFHFENLTKNTKIGVSSKEMGTFIKLARQSRGGKCPSFVQPSALTW